jgi:glutaminyl-peptide cyclotransferase
VPEVGWSVVSRRPHDAAAFTQGLQLDGAGRLFESTGLYGRSTVREVDPLSGAVLRSVSLPDRLFAEGLALVDDRLVQLTWREGRARLWDADTFELLDTFRYEGEGWGLCHDGQRLVMSDGSDVLTFRDPVTFEVEGSVQVDHAGYERLPINELECVAGAVWANLWQTDTIVRIDPHSGAITGSLDLAPLHEEILADPTASRAGEPPDVLNGIAWDEAAGTFLVTGKRWPTLFEIRLDPPG